LLVNWQVEASGKVETNAPIQRSGTLYPPQTIFYMDDTGDGKTLSVYAVERDGTDLGIVEFGWLSNASVEGTRFAYLISSKDTGTTSLIVVEPGREAEVLFEAEEGEPYTAAGLLTWSPDATRIALALDYYDGRRIVVVDAQSGQIHNKFLLPREMLALHQIEWSPDGKKLLLIGWPVAVLDTEIGEIETVVEGGLWMVGSYVPTREIQWLSGSDALIYINREYVGRDQWEPPVLWYKKLGENEKPQQLLTPEQLMELGLDIDDLLSIKISRAGSYLALAEMGYGSADSAAILVFELALLQSTLLDNQSLPSPLGQWELPGMISSLEWSSNEQELAFLTVSDLGSSIQILPISAPSSQKVADLRLTQEQFTTIWMWDMVHWAP
jgi:hypothetical protein